MLVRNLLAIFIPLLLLALVWFLSRFIPEVPPEERVFPASGLTLDELLPVLCNRKVTLMGNRWNRCCDVRDIVKEFVEWAGGVAADDLTSGEFNLWIQCRGGNYRISIAASHRKDIPKFDQEVPCDGTPALGFVESLASHATFCLCEYVRHFSKSMTAGQGEEAEKSGGRCQHLASELRADLSTQMERLAHRSITVCGYPDFAPWLGYVVEGIASELSQHKASVHVDLIESAVPHHAGSDDDIEVVLISAHRFVAPRSPGILGVIVKYRITPRHLWQHKRQSTQEVQGVEGECHLHYFAEPRGVARLEDVIAYRGGAFQQYTFEGRDFTPIFCGICQVLSDVDSYEANGPVKTT